MKNSCPKAPTGVQRKTNVKSKTECSRASKSHEKCPKSDMTITTRPSMLIAELANKSSMKLTTKEMSEEILDDLDNTRSSKHIGMQTHQISKTTFNFPEEDSKESQLERLHDLTHVSKISFKPLPDDLKKSPKTMRRLRHQKPLEASYIKGKSPTFPRTMSGHSKSKLLHLKVSRGNIISLANMESKTKLNPSASSSRLTIVNGGKNPPQIEVEEDNFPHLAAYPSVAAAPSLKSLKRVRSSHFQSRQSLAKATSTLLVQKSLQNLKKSPSRVRQSLKKSTSTPVLRKMSIKVKRKHKGHKSKVSIKVSNYPAIYSATASPQEEREEDDSQLPEELRLMRFVKKWKMLTDFLRKLKASLEKPKENLGTTVSRIQLRFEETPKFTGKRDAKVESVFGLVVDPKQSMFQQQQSKQPFSLKRSFNSSGEMADPPAKRFMDVVDQLSSGSSSDGYTEWKAHMLTKQPYLEAGDANRSSGTETSSSIEEENLHTVSLLKRPTLSEDTSSESTLISESKYKIIDMTKPSHSKAKPIAERSNSGKFVHPLTGSVLLTPSSSSMSSTSLELHNEDVEKKGEENSQHGNYEDPALYPPLLNDEDFYIDASLFQAWDEQYDQIQEEDLTNTTTTEETKALTCFMEQSLHLQQNIPKSPVVKMKTFIDMLPQTVNDFLDSLINRCVSQMEKMHNQEETLRKSLCKRKLIEELSKLLFEQQVENKVFDFLNHHVIEYLRRRQKISLITEEKPRFEKSSRESYYYVTERLDKLLMREENTRKYCTQKVEEESNMYKEIQKRSSAAIEGLEQFIMSSLIRDTQQEKLQQSIDGQLRKMSRLRQEISKSRYKLIDQQHTLCTLTQHSVKSQRVGDGLCLKDFDSLNVEIHDLTKQLQEQEAKNERLRTHCSAYIEQTSHIRSQISILRSSTEAKKLTLNDLYATVRWQRYRICAMKSQHMKIRQMVNKLKYQCGVMSKPLLMADYDETAKRIEELQRAIDSWKLHSTRIELQIKALDEKCLNRRRS